MTDDEIIGRILEDGHDDWVDLDMLERRIAPGSEPAPLPETVRIIRRLLDEKLMVVGDVLESGFVAWQCSTEDAIERIEREWKAQNGKIVLGDICWFDLTSVGEARLRELSESR